MRGPIGRWFTWDVRTPALCLVGGTGVVPAVSMSRAARQAGTPGLLRVLAVGRTPGELPYDEELRRFGATMAYTRHATPDRAPGPPSAAELAPLLAGTELTYVCGSSRFAGLAESLLMDSGVPPDRIRVEQFGATG
jgi:ferredoxin-NADP reductase